MGGILRKLADFDFFQFSVFMLYKSKRHHLSVHCARVEIGRKLISVLVEGTLPTCSIKIDLNDHVGTGRKK